MNPRFKALAYLPTALLIGCVSTDPVKFAAQIREWVPPGTPAAEAKRKMERHGFECHMITTNHPFNSTGVDYLECEIRQVRFHDWRARLMFKDGKVAGYGPLEADCYGSKACWGQLDCWRRPPATKPTIVGCRWRG
jgi:hypothetical protein